MFYFPNCDRSDIIVQEILHGREILPLERDRFVNGLISLIIGEQG